MIVVDSSVVVAILKGEPDEAKLTNALLGEERHLMSAGNYLECAIVALQRGPGGRTDLDELLALRRIEIVPVDVVIAKLAADAFARFGKGRHPAGLNYGDCFAYALARHLRRRSCSRAATSPGPISSRR